MKTKDLKKEIECVPCSICMKEIPRSEALIPEATDYFVNFCGLTCYDKWKSEIKKPAV